MSNQTSPAHAAANVPAVCSLLCLGLQAVWVALCYFFATTSRSDVTAEDMVKQLLAVLGAMLGAFVGVCLLSAVGVVFGVAGRRSGWGMLALVLNVAAFLLTAIPLLLLILTPRTQ